MGKIYRSVLIFTLALLACTAVSGCGKKKEPEAAASQVMKLTITPEVTPTLAPEQINPDAVERTGNLTMINEYTAALGGGGVDPAQAEADLEKAVLENTDGTDSNGTDSNGTDSGEADASGSDYGTEEDGSDENME